MKGKKILSSLNVKKGKNILSYLKEIILGRMEKARWFLLIPFTFGIIAFALGYFLDAEIVRIIWLVLSGLMIVMGFMCFLMMSIMYKVISNK